MKKLFLSVLAIGLTLTTLVGCGGTGEANNKKGSDTIRIVWYPNESGGDLEEARSEIGKIVEKATGKKVEHKLTTDYSIAIETLANDGAEIGFTGAQGYVEANAKNKNIKPLVVPTGPSGTLDDAVYYSWLAVKDGNEDNYKVADNYSIDKIKGQKISFVSNSSTSGFKVPANSIIKHFESEKLTQEDLMQGGKDKFFNEVYFGATHQGSAVNLLTDKSDVAAFCDTVMINYIDTVEGEFNAVGTTYKIKDNSTQPFNNLIGEKFVAIQSTPVLNSPFVMNTGIISEEEQKKLIDTFTSDETCNNELIFIKEGSNKKGFFTRTDKEKFLSVVDEWFDPVRALSK
ncbi:MAG: PhnD/SsuA/transferrin family substrate-binding protein [Sarcina sp.]